MSAFCISGRYQAGVCSMDGLVFAVGGCDAWNCLSSVEVYDPQTDVWTFAKGMITARRGCGLAVFKGCFLVLTFFFFFCINQDIGITLTNFETFLS
jgi:hypothetical protein